MNILSAIKCLILVQVITTWALEEIPAPNLSSGQKYIQPWTNLEHHKENVLDRSDSEPVLWDTPRTLQQSVRSQWGVGGQFGLFLHGLGVVNDKCQFVRKEGGSPSDNCLKGGMSCKKKCEYKTTEPVYEPQIVVRKIWKCQVSCIHYQTLGCLWRCSWRSLWNCQW